MRGNYRLIDKQPNTALNSDAQKAARRLANSLARQKYEENHDCNSIYARICFGCYCHDQALCDQRN